jgi:nucleoside-diphosphate-sugar epimerase
MDLLDLPALRQAAEGCAAIVHLGALAHDTAGSPEQIMAVNVLGTWHVLLAAEAAGIAKVVHFSSAQVFGIAEAERTPDFFPVDDEHPRRAMRAADICATEPSLDAAARLAPGVPIKDPARYQVDPRRALIDCFAAEAILGWRPAYGWSGRGQKIAR